MTTLRSTLVVLDLLNSDVYPGRTPGGSLPLPPSFLHGHGALARGRTHAARLRAAADLTDAAAAVDASADPQQRRNDAPHGRPPPTTPAPDDEQSELAPQQGLTSTIGSPAALHAAAPPMLTAPLSATQAPSQIAQLLNSEEHYVDHQVVRTPRNPNESKIEQGQIPTLYLVASSGRTASGRTRLPESHGGPLGVH